MIEFPFSQRMRFFFAALIGVVFSTVLVIASAMADQGAAEPEQLAQNYPRQTPSWAGQQRQYQFSPQPRIPGYGGGVATCAAQGYSCPSGHRCVALGTREKPVSRSGARWYFACVPQGHSNGCYVGFRRQDRSDGSYSCTPQWPRGMCGGTIGTWGPRQRGAGMGIACRHII